MIRSVKMAAVCLGLAGFSYTGTAQERERDATLSAEEDQNQLRIRSEQVVDLINGEIEPDAILSEAFLQALPVPQVKAFSNSLTSQYGQAVAVETFNPIGDTRAVLDVRFERAIARGGIEIAPDEDNRISGLRFTSIDPVATDDDSAEKISAELNALPGEVSAYFGPIGQDGTAPAISIQPDKQMPLGSAFKLYVLATLAQDIAEGTRSWSDVVELQSKSFPSGRMQDWPQGSPTTLHTLAVMMISISDNTATDELVRVLGRDRILEVMAETGHPSPELNDPFMTTRELFLLKGGNQDRLQTYRTANADLRRQILDGLEVNPPSAEDVEAAFLQGPRAIDVEWFASAKDLEKLFVSLDQGTDSQALNIMAVNSGLKPTVKEKWAYVGFKGGSEPGVLNFTWLLKDETGTRHLLVLSWSNPVANVDEEKLLLLAERILLLPR